MSLSSSRRVRVGVLGAGAWARAAHLPGFARDSRCELVAIADTTPELAAAAAAEFGIPHVYPSHEALIAHDGLDLIDVCTPSSTHFALSWAALESAGRAVQLFLVPGAQHGFTAAEEAVARPVVDAFLAAQLR